MAKNMDARSSLLYLIDNLPSWQATIDQLTTHAVQKNAEFVAEYARLVNKVKPQRRKSPSMASIHTFDDDEIPETYRSTDGFPPLPDQAEINPLEAGNRYLFAQARRKRKPGSSIRSNASGPQKFRNKSQVVVYYDGHLQEQLDSLVKTIGIARNNLRKGKNALAVAKGFQLPTLSRRAGHGHASLESLRTIAMSRSIPSLIPGEKIDVPVSTPALDAESSFLQVDKDLEVTQSLCETASHQFLRDGDCKAELDSIRQKFNNLLAQADITVDALKQLEETKNGESEADCNNPKTSEKYSFNCSDVTLSTQPSMEALRTPKLGAHIGPSHLTISNTLENMKSQGAFFSAPAIATDNNPVMMTDHIEVDDESDQDSIVVDISAYRLANSRRTRT